MGNCGFTLAPAPRPTRTSSSGTSSGRRTSRPRRWKRGSIGGGRPSPSSSTAWSALPKGINYAGYIGHSALRTYVMGERAFEEQAGEDGHGGDGARAARRDPRGRHRLHHLAIAEPRDAGGSPVASRSPAWDEVRRLVGVMGDLNAGIMELAGEGVDRTRRRPGCARLPRATARLAVESGRPITFGVSAGARCPTSGVRTSPCSTRRRRRAGACSRRFIAARSARCSRSGPSCPSTSCRSGRTSARSRWPSSGRGSRDPRVAAPSGRCGRRAVGP